MTVEGISIIPPPLPPPPPPKRYWGAWATVGLSAAVIAIMLMIQVAMTVVYVFLRMAREPDLDLFGLLESPGQFGFFIILSVALTSAIGAGLVIGAIKLRSNSNLKDYLALHVPRPRALLIAIAVFGGLVLAMQGADMVLQRPPPEDMLSDAYRTVGSPLFFWVTVVIIGPVFEEMLFRGFLFVGLRDSRIGLAGTLLITSLAWAAMHIQYDLYGMFWILVLGLALGLVRHRTNSLWVVIILHGLNNAAATLQIALSVGG